MDADIFQIADAIRIFKGLTITEVASETRINRGNLNAWLKSGSPDRLSSDKIKKIFDYLEIDLDPLRLRPGIHRFTIPKPTINNVNLIVSVIHGFFPEGGTVFPVRKKSYSETIGLYEFDNKSFFSGIQEIIWVAVPKFIHDVRVAFKMAEKKQLMPARSLLQPFPSGPWNWADNSSSKSNGGRDLPDQVFSRLAYDESLTVPELDKILSIFSETPPLDGASFAREDEAENTWTWNLVLRRAREAGLKPEEVAKRLGLSE